MMKVAWPGSNQIILVSGLKTVAKSQSELWRLITNSSAKFKADPVSGVYAKGYHMIGTNSANSAGDDHQQIRAGEARNYFVPMSGKWSTDQRPGNSKTWAERDQKFIRPVKAHNHQFVCKRAENSKAWWAAEQADMVNPMSPSNSVDVR